MGLGLVVNNDGGEDDEFASEGWLISCLRMLKLLDSGYLCGTFHEAKASRDIIWNKYEL